MLVTSQILLQTIPIHSPTHILNRSGHVGPIDYDPCLKYGPYVSLIRLFNRFLNENEIVMVQFQGVSLVHRVVHQLISLIKILYCTLINTLCGSKIGIHQQNNSSYHRYNVNFLELAKLWRMKNN